ncbi:hypothetical protein MKK68_21220, partial [Methylobacterium sp. E-016]|nr:hypothetical protein [Methylobacterium sp. E-016]
MGAILSFFRPAPIARGDWSQQEIAEFYRVEAALTQAGLRITSDRGLSDEGDPWFVFCRFDGDVIMHFARIDDLYVVASEAFERPLQGPDFRVLLNAVAAEHPTLVPVPRQTTQGKTGNLVLHPAALLAALVATVAFQLAGGDAMAGELATDGPPEPMHQPGTEGGAYDRLTTTAHSDPHPQTAKDELGRLAGEDEGRHARQSLVLSAITLISMSLTASEVVDNTSHILSETAAVSTRGPAITAPVAEASQAAADGRTSQVRNEAAQDTSVVLSAATSSEPVQVWAALTGRASAPAFVGSTNLLHLNVLELGAAGGQEIAAMRAAESAPPIPAILVSRIAAHAVPVAVEKASTAAPMLADGPAAASTPALSAGSASTGSAAPSTLAAASTATVAVGGTSAAPITAFLAVSAVEVGSGRASGSVGASAALGTNSAALANATASTTSQLSAQSPAVVAAVTASVSEKIAAPTVFALVAQPPFDTANLAVRTALSSFFDQKADITKANMSVLEAASTFKLSELTLASLTKLLGTGAVSEFVTNFTAYSGSVAASKAIMPSLAIDTTAVTSSSSSVFAGTNTNLSGETVKDKFATPVLESETKVINKIDASVTKPVTADVTKVGLGEKTALTDTATSTGSKDAASSHTDTKATDQSTDTATKIVTADVTKVGLG